VFAAPEGAVSTPGAARRVPTKKGEATAITRRPTLFLF